MALVVRIKMRRRAFLSLLIILLQPFGLVSPALAATIEMEHNNSHPAHAPKVVNGIEYQYDANGNLLNDGERVISWNADNKPVKVVKDGKAVDIFYDADGRRVVKKSGQDKTIYPNQFLTIEQFNNLTIPKYYYFAGDRRIAQSAENLSYLHHDHLGSTALATDSDSQPLGKPLVYFPYGSSIDHVAIQPFSHFLFTGQEHDPETNLYNHKARLYEARGGFFISADSFIDDPEAAIAFNRYAYGRTNPLKFVDRQGLQPEDVAGFPLLAKPSFTREEREKVKAAITNALSLIDPETAAFLKSPIFLLEEVKIGERSFAAATGYVETATGERAFRMQFARKFLQIGRKPHWVLHEMGHLLEEKKGDLSQQLAFGEALAVRYPYIGETELTYGFYDVLEYFQKQQGTGYGYALQYLEAEEELRLDEAFAEAFAFYTEESKVMGYVSALVDYFNQLLGLEKQFPQLQLPVPLSLRREILRERLLEQRLPEF